MQTRVLMIDDDIAMTEMLQVALEAKSFKVETVHTGKEGIEAARRLKPDVVVLDLYMPGMGGLEVCRGIREFSQVPILVLSAMSKPGTATHALDEGADDFLIKPVPSNVLIAHLNNLTRRARAERDATSAKDPLTCN